jgi:predicted Zn-ribbon and HTH transcriptional regulator
MDDQGPAEAVSEDLPEPRRCPVCRTKIVEVDGDGFVVRNAILRVGRETGHARAKCPRCKAWVEVPPTYTP